MRIIKSIIIAFSMYSRIPMPQFEWKEEDMKYMLCFFPWIGAVTGGLIYLWKIICDRFGAGELCYTMIGAAIPVLVTGGFHVDGFMDTMDALHSYQPKEKKLEILKDSHIGAFAVIMLALYGMLYIGAFSEIKDNNILKILCAGFALSRCLSGIGVVTFKSAKHDGLLFTFADNAQKNIVKIALYLQAVICLAYMLWQSSVAGAAAVVTVIIVFAYYYYRSKKEFGGITGDTAGYFVVLCEGGMTIILALLEIFLFNA